MKTIVLVFVMLLSVFPSTLLAQSRDAVGKKQHFDVAQMADRLIISHGGKPIAEFVFNDPKILRPYFANVLTPGGVLATRNHPPRPDVDATDHDTMHPGIWLGFGDLGGADFWRNKGRIEHFRFTVPPVEADGRLKFATQSRLLNADGALICMLDNHFTLATGKSGWLLVWDARFHSNEGDFAFGDQEEMGFGARVATPLTEKNGGRILSSRGKSSAANTWGQPAQWCDYSGSVNGHQAGITLMAASSNFRESWWHNRDYGVFVANAFGRAAMRQGEKSVVTVKRGEQFRLCYGACIHDGGDYDPSVAYEDFQKQLGITPQSNK